MSSHKTVKPDAISMLLDEHKRIRKLFKEFDKCVQKNSQPCKVEVAQQLCEELSAHIQLKEDVFYPAVRALTDDSNLVDQSQVEHNSARELIEQIHAMDGSEPLYDAKLFVLREHVEHHFSEEEQKMFVTAQKSKMDLRKLAQAMRDRKLEMTVELV